MQILDFSYGLITGIYIVLLIDIKETIDINILKITFISVLATFLTILIFIIIYYINNIFHKYYDIKHT